MASNECENEEFLNYGSFELKMGKNAYLEVGRGKLTSWLTKNANNIKRSEECRMP